MANAKVEVQVYVDTSSNRNSITILMWRERDVDLFFTFFIIDYDRGIQDKMRFESSELWEKILVSIHNVIYEDEDENPKMHYAL